jgi:hypothetical protein
VTPFIRGRRIPPWTGTNRSRNHICPPDIVKLAFEQHGPVIRLAYMEIASGMNRLLRRGIPKAYNKD